ncbi:MAG: transposase [Planctomycetaceae bacterium]
MTSPLLRKPVRRPRYPSDLTDSQWNRISPLLPSPAEVGRHRRVDLREVLNGINFRWTTGCVWRMLPHDLPPWGTIYTYYRDWQRSGLLPQIREELTRRQSRRRTPPRRDATNAPRLPAATTTKWSSPHAEATERLPQSHRDAPAFPASAEPRQSSDHGDAAIRPTPLDRQNPLSGASHSVGSPRNSHSETLP